MVNVMGEFGIGHIILIVIVLFLLVPIVRGYREGRNEYSSSAPVAVGNKEFETEVVGESHYQPNLLALCGAKTRESVNKFFVAELVPEDSNPHDPKAVRVDIDGKTVGYLSRPDARTWRKLHRNDRKVRHNAVVRGGWDRGARDQGSFGVRLDISA